MTEDYERIVVGQDYIGDFYISTVSIRGLKLQVDYFETMVFEHKDKEILNWHEIECLRYGTKKSALKGHRQTVRKWKHYVEASADLQHFQELNESVWDY